MAGISVKLTADVTGFKKNINEATQSVKTLDAQLETNEKQLKLNGDAELYMKNKAALLEQQLEAQRKVVVSTHNALEAMKKNGVSPASSEFQKMEQNLAKAQSKMVDIQTNIKEVEKGASGAKTETNGMNTELKKIGKGVAFENVTSGLKTITEKLESAGRAAVNLGKKLVSSAKDSTGWADDVLTRATKWGVDAETVQRMDNVAKYIDTDAEAIVTAWDKIAKSAGNGKLGELLGIDTAGMSADDAFWAAGEALMALSDTMDDLELDDTARKIFGTGWRDLLPLLKAGRQEYEQLLNEQNVLTNEQVENLGKADDELQKMELEVQRLKNEFWAENSQTIINLLQWLLDNKDGVVTALTVIGGAFAAMKIGEFALNLQKTVSGFKDLLGLAGKGAETGGSTAANTAGGGLFKGLIAKAGSAFAANGLWALAPATLVTAALKTSVDATNAANADVWNAQQSRLSGAYSLGGADADFIIRAANAIGLKTDANGNAITGFMGMTSTNATGSSVTELLDELGRRSDEDKALLLAMISGGDYNNTLGNDTALMLQRYWNGEGFDMTELTSLLGNVVDSILQGESDGGNAPEALIDAMSKAYEDYYNALYVSHDALAEQQAKETINDLLTNPQWADQWEELPTDFKWALEDALKEGYGGDILSAMQAAADELSTLPADVASAVENANITVVVPSAGGYSNGLFSVPWDGFPAILHKGERVLTARENQQYTYNNYFGNVSLNNGLEIDALTDSIARRNQRQRSGFGAA